MGRERTFIRRLLSLGEWYPGIFPLPQAPPDEAVDNYLLKVIDTDDGAVSSAIYLGRNSAGEGIALTADHVVRPEGVLRRWVQIEFNRIPGSAAVISRWEPSQKDTALLKIDASAIDGLLRAGLCEPSFRLFWRRGMPVVMAGYPSGAGAIEKVLAEIHRGHGTVLAKFTSDISESEQRYLYFHFDKGIALGGMSGGPVLECGYGRLIGVIEGRHPILVMKVNGQKQIVPGGGLAIPLSDFFNDFPDDLKDFERKWVRKCLVGISLMILAFLVVLAPAGIFAVRVWHDQVPPKPPDVLPDPDVVRIDVSSAQGGVELLTGHQVVKAELRGKLEKRLSDGDLVYVMKTSGREAEIELLGPANLNRSGWTMQVQFRAPDSFDSARFELVPVVAKDRPMVDEQKFEEWRQKNGAAIVVIKVASLTIDSVQSAGAYADLRGEARNLPDGAKVVVEAVDERDEPLKRLAVVRVLDHEWKASRVAMRDSNQQGGQVRVRVALSPEEKNVHSGDKIASEPKDVSVPNPYVRITHINGKELKGNLNCPGIAPKTRVKVRGEVGNLLEGDMRWVLILGNSQWPGVNEAWITEKLDGQGRIYWSKEIDVKEASSTPPAFTVVAGVCSPPPHGAPDHAVRDRGYPVECKSKEK